MKYRSPPPFPSRYIIPFLLVPPKSTGNAPFGIRLGLLLQSLPSPRTSTVIRFFYGVSPETSVRDKLLPTKSPNSTPEYAPFFILPQFDLLARSLRFVFTSALPSHCLPPTPKTGNVNETPPPFPRTIPRAIVDPGEAGLFSFLFSYGMTT